MSETRVTLDLDAIGASTAEIGSVVSLKVDQITYRIGRWVEKDGRRVLELDSMQLAEIEIRQLSQVIRETKGQFLPQALHELSSLLQMTDGN